MTVKDVNRALENSLKNKSSYAALVHSLYTLECSDELIRVIVVGAYGDEVKDRITPLIRMVRSYENLTAAEQLDILYAFVDKQDRIPSEKSLDTRLSA